MFLGFLFFVVVVFWGFFFDKSFLTTAKLDLQHNHALNYWNHWNPQEQYEFSKTRVGLKLIRSF